MESPVRIIRESLKMSQTDMAINSGVSQSHISNVEGGFSNINQRLLKFLKSLYINGEELEERQKEYMKEVKKELLDRTRAKSELIKQGN